LTWWSSSSFFICIIALSVVLVRSVLNEVKHREEVDKLNKELEAKNKLNQELLDMKSEFLHIVNHQLKHAAIHYAQRFRDDQG